MTVKEFMSYLMNHYCPHDIFINKEPEHRCEQFQHEHNTMACTFCWIFNITEHEVDEEDL